MNLSMPLSPQPPFAPPQPMFAEASPPKFPPLPYESEMPESLLFAPTPAPEAGEGSPESSNGHAPAPVNIIPELDAPFQAPAPFPAPYPGTTASFFAASILSDPHFVRSASLHLAIKSLF